MIDKPVRQPPGRSGFGTDYGIAPPPLRTLLMSAIGIYRQLTSSFVDFEFPMSSYQIISIRSKSSLSSQVIEVCGDRVPMDERHEPKQALPGPRYN